MNHIERRVLARIRVVDPAFYRFVIANVNQNTLGQTPPIYGGPHPYPSYGSAPTAGGNGWLDKLQELADFYYTNKAEKARIEAEIEKAKIDAQILTMQQQQQVQTSFPASTFGVAPATGAIAIIGLLALFALGRTQRAR